MLLLQLFIFYVKDRKGCKNQIVNYLSILVNEGSELDELQINDAFPNEQVFYLLLTLCLGIWTLQINLCVILFQRS